MRSGPFNSPHNDERERREREKKSTCQPESHLYFQDELSQTKGVAQKYHCVMWLISRRIYCKWLLKTSHSSAALARTHPFDQRHWARKHAAGDRYQSRLSNHTHTSPLWHVLIYLPLLRGSTASQSVWIIPRGPTTAVSTDRETLQLKRKDSSGPFSIGVLTLMDTQTTPSCLRIRILCKHAAIPSLFALKA